MKYIYVKIANYKIKIILPDNIHPIYRNSLEKSLKKWLSPFILYPKSYITTDIQFNFVKQKSWEIIKPMENNIQRFYHIFYEVQNNKYIVNYHISIFQFLFLLKKALQQVLSKSGYGFFFHCSACIYNKKLLLFTAQPNGGKSTILKLLTDFGATPLVDDYGIIIKEKNKFYFYQSPFIETNQIRIKSNKKYPLKNVFFLRKSKTNSLTLIEDKSYILKRVIKQIFIHEQLSPSQSKTLLDFSLLNNFCYLAFNKNENGLKEFIDKSNKTI